MTTPSLSFKSSVASTSCLTAQRPVAVTSRQDLLVEDRVRIRLSRFGRKKRPFYRIVAVDSRAPRETHVLEYLGWHDPLKKETNLNAPAIKKWISVGAQPSDTVGSILRKAMVIDTP